MRQASKVVTFRATYTNNYLRANTVTTPVTLTVELHSRWFWYLVFTFDK